MKCARLAKITELISQVWSWYDRARCTEIWHILAVHIVWSCDLDFCLFSLKIRLLVQEHVTKICAYFEVYRQLLFLKYETINFKCRVPVANHWHCYGNYLVSHLLGGHPHVIRQVWTWNDHPHHSHDTFCIDYVPVWPLTCFLQNGVTWPGPYVLKIVPVLKFFKYAAVICRFRGPVARHPPLP